MSFKHLTFTNSSKWLTDNDENTCNPGYDDRVDASLYWPIPLTLVQIVVEGIDACHVHHKSYRPVSVPAFPAILPSRGSLSKGSYSQPSFSQCRPRSKGLNNKSYCFWNASIHERYFQLGSQEFYLL